MTILIDAIFTIGTCSFIAAGIRQLRRIYKTKSTNGLSLTKYHIKIWALSWMMVGYFLSGLPLSISVSFIDMILNIMAIYLITKYRHIKFWSW